MIYEAGKYNLHTHSFYCGHGEGQLKDYVREAKKASIEVLGFSEHCPVKENRWARSRMDYNQIEDYLGDIDDLKEKEAELAQNYKYVDKEDKNITQLKPIKVLSGFECDYRKEYHSYLQEIKDRTDFLIFGVHYLDLPTQRDHSVHSYPLTRKTLNAYADQYIKAIESGLFSIGAHPDLFFIQYFKWDEQAKAISKAIIEAAAYYDVALEVNGNGILKRRVRGFNGGKRFIYPVEEFWKLAASYDDLKIITNSDAHSPYVMEESFEMCETFADEVSFEYSKADFNELDSSGIIKFINEE